MTVQTGTSTSALETLLKPKAGELDNPAFIQTLPDGSERKVSRAQYDQLIKRAITMLEKSGVKSGDRVVMSSPNTPEMAALIMAVWRLGVMAVPVDFRMTSSELGNVAQKLACKMVVVYKPIVKEVETLEKTLADAGIKFACLTEIGSHQPDNKDRPLTAFASLKDSAFLILTSGTTGMPKAAEHCLETLMINLRELTEMAGITSAQTALVPVPISHVLGLEVILAVHLVGGTVLFSELSIPGIVACINKYKPAIMVGVPTIYGALAAMAAGAVDMSGAQVTLCGGAPLPLSLANEFEKHFGKRINNGYGSTESKIMAVNMAGPVESVGKIAPSTRVEIRDPQGNCLPEGESGEIVICGPILMKGYFGQPDATKAVMENDCYMTGDHGYIKDGYLFINGRAKEMIIVAGNKVFPSEVEDVLRRNSMVKEVAVIGVPHSKLGQIVKAIIVIDGKEWSEKLEGDDEAKLEAKKSLREILKEFCNQHLKRELRPMDWEFRPASQPLPKTSSGKVDKKQMS